MRSDTAYSYVFSQSAPLRVWPVIARILKKVDALLENVRPVGTGASERFLKNWRQITAFLATSRAFGSFAFTASQLAELSPDVMSNDLLASTWEFVRTRATSYISRKNRIGRGGVFHVCREAAESFSLSGLGVVEGSRFIETEHREQLPADFVERVDAALPPQPWKPGIHLDVAVRLGCRSTGVSAAIQTLIASGRRNHQKDGVVYAPDGTVLARDPERARPELKPLGEDANLARTFSADHTRHPGSVGRQR
jgi:hypothetical protein